MSKKDYVLLAAALKASRPDHWSKFLQWEMDVKCITAHLAEANRAFKRDTFIAACGGLYEVKEMK